MRIIGRLFRILVYGVGIAVLFFTVPQLYHKYSDYVQKERIFTKVQQATNQVSNAAAPEDWQTLNNWWLVNQNGTLIYDATNLTAQDQAAVHQAAAWWNQMAGKDIVIQQENATQKADVYITYVNDKYLNFSGLTGTNHLLLINRASLVAQSDESNVNNDTVNILIHELGHALGLAHAPQSYNDVMSPKQVADGTIKTVSNYDRGALKASFRRMTSALHQNMSEDSYMQVASQTPYPDLNRIGDETYNARDGVASTLNSTLAKVKKEKGMTDQQKNILSDSETSLKAIQDNDLASDKAIVTAQENLKALIEAFHLQNDFPQAYPDGASGSGSEKVDHFIQKIQDTF